MEKIDIIQWNEEIKLFIQSALSPARDIEVIVNEKNKTADALVPEDQLSFAIGKEGQNVRLAARLTGWKINIKSKSEIAAADLNKKEKTKTTKANNKKDSKSKKEKNG